MGLLYGAEQIAAGYQAARYEAGFIFLQSGFRASMNNINGLPAFVRKNTSDAVRLDLFRC